MKLILKYLKPFAVLACIAVALLFIQNFADLALPNYMSEIVNVGIMRGGIRDAVPRAMSEDAYGLVIAFMSEDDKASLKAPMNWLIPVRKKVKEQRRSSRHCRRSPLTCSMLLPTMRS